MMQGFGYLDWGFHTVSFVVYQRPISRDFDCKKMVSVSRESSLMGKTDLKRLLDVLERRYKMSFYHTSCQKKRRKNNLQW